MTDTHDGKVEYFELLNIFEPEAVYVSPYGKRIDFLIRGGEYYNATCPFLGMDVNYETRKLEFYGVEDPSKPTDGDGLFDITLTKRGWERVLKSIGTYEDNKARLDQLHVNTAVGNKLPNNVKNKIKGFLGRRTRKACKPRTRRTRQTRF